jgi:hypothetical protein
LKQEFNSDAKTTEVQRITNLGFNTFEANAQIEYIDSMQAQYFPNFSAHIADQANISPDLVSLVQGYLDTIQFT